MPVGVGYKPSNVQFQPSVYNPVVIKYSLSWSPDVQSDLDAVYAQDDADGLFVDELFELLDENEKVRENLALGRFQRIPDPRFDAALLQSAKDAGYNIYYLKTWRRDGVLVPWRVIYGVLHGLRNTKIRILGLMPRSDDYDHKSISLQRMFADYDSYGIPRIPKRQS